MRLRRLTRWQWLEVIAVAGPAILIMPMAGLALLGGLLGVAGFLTPGSIADLGLEPVMAMSVVLWLPIVGVVAFPALLVAIVFGPRQICARSGLRWVVLACGGAGVATAAALLTQPGGDGVWDDAFGWAVFGLPAAIGLRYMGLLLTTRLSAEDRSLLRAPTRPASAPPVRPERPHRRPSSGSSRKALLRLASVLAAAIVLLAAGITAWVFWPKPDGIHRTYFAWAGEQFFWGSKEHLKSEVPYQDGKRHGVARIYQRNSGALKEERTYENGRLHGPTTTYFFSRPSVVQSVTLFERGVRQWMKSYTLEGWLQREVEYTDGKDRWRFVRYDRLGRVVEEGTRRGGWTLESVSTTYGPDGEVLTRTRYRHGEGRQAMPLGAGPPGSRED